MLSMIAVAAKSWLLLTTWVSSNSDDFAFASRAARRSPKSDVSMAAPGAGQDGSGPDQPQQSRRLQPVHLLTATCGRDRPMAGRNGRRAGRNAARPPRKQELREAFAALPISAR